MASLSEESRLKPVRIPISTAIGNGHGQDCRKESGDNGPDLRSGRGLPTMMSKAFPLVAKAR